MDELRVFVFCITLLAIFGFLVGNMPSEFLWTGATYDLMTYRDEWKAGEIIIGNVSAYSNTTIAKNTRALTTEFSEVNAVIEGNVYAQWFYNPVMGWDHIRIVHYWVSWWGLVTEWDQGIPDITRQYAIDHLTDEDVSVMIVSCGHYEFGVQLYYDDSVYSTFISAWDAGDLRIWVGLGSTWNDSMIQQSLVTLVSQLMLFQAPDIHPAINFIIAFPLWACIAGVCYVMIVKVWGGG